MSMTLKERIAKYDADPIMHYYVYFSSSSYKFTVDVIQFKSLEDIKSEYYATLKYYDTYEEAEAVAEEMNRNDDNINHLFCRELVKFNNKINELKNVNHSKLTALDTKAIDTLRDTTALVEYLFSTKEET